MSAPAVRLHIIVRPNLRDRLKKLNVFPSTIKKRLERVLKHDLLADVVPLRCELCLTLMDDHEIHELNHMYRDRDRPTDVLSFAMLEGEVFALPEEIPTPLGDLMISLDTAERQAERGALPRLKPALTTPVWSCSEEVSFLALHGLLHLLGFDHETDHEAEVMEDLELRLLGCLLPRSAKNL